MGVVAELPAAEDYALLESLGIHVASGDRDSEAHAECVRIARRLIVGRRKVIGFVPARADVAVPPLAIQLGLALVELSGATAAYVDANVRQPALSELAANEPTENEGTSLFSTRWLSEALAVLTPGKTEHPGEAVPALAALLINGSRLFSHILVDLTGFDELGEHASAAACCDGVILVGRAHRTRERDILQFMNEMPESRFLGVLLVG